MRHLTKPLIAGGRRGKGKSCEFVLHVDLSETDKACTMKMETVLGPRLLQKPVQDALLGPLLDHIYKPKVNGPMNVHVHATLEGDLPIDTTAPAREFERESGVPVDIYVVVTQHAEPAGGESAAVDGGGRFASEVPPTGATFNLTIETVDGFEHKGLPSEGAVLCTSLAPKWLRKPLRSALIAPLLDGINGARPKGAAKLGVGNVLGVSGADGEVIGLEAVAASLVREDNEPVHLKVLFGEANGGRVSQGSLEEEEVASNASGEERPKVETLPRLKGLRAFGAKLGRGACGTFHLHAGEVATKALLPKGALSKPLEDVLIAPFLERLQGKGGSFSIVDSTKLQSARIEVDGETVDLSKPAGSFVRDPNEPVVIVFRMDSDDTASEAGSDAPPYGGNYAEEAALSVGLADVALDGPLFTEAEPESPFGGSIGSEGSAAVFTTTHNNRALARARAARLSRQTSSGSMGSMGSPGRCESNGSVTDAVTTNGLIDFGTQ